MIYRIIVDKQSRKNPSSQKREYEINIEELRTKGDIYDSLIFKIEETYVMRCLNLSELHVLSVLKEPIKELIGNIKIELFKGDNYIYLIDTEGNRFYAEYLVKNEFNEMFATRKEMNSTINQTMQEIDLAVNQKFTNYSTIEEMNASINLKADEITSIVSKTYSTRTDTEEQINKAKSEIRQTTDNISSEVSEKVGNNEIVSKINQSAEKVKINANKIELSANDVLDLLAGNTINLSGKKIKIASDNFNVDEYGKVNCSNINIKGGQIHLTDVSGVGNEFQVNSNESYFWVGSSFHTLENKLTGAFIFTDVSETNNATIMLNANGSTTHLTATGIDTPIVNQRSLESIKKNISKSNINALNIIKNSDIYEYNLKTEKNRDKKHIGFVIGEKYNTPYEVISNDNKGIDIYNMRSITWKGVQELIVENKKLTKRIEKLEAKM